MIENVLPSCATYAEAFGDAPESVLHPAETTLVAGAVERRRREFATVRHCARLALGQLGFPPLPLLRGERGAPLWPTGVVGSMTHCDGYRAAAVARSSDLKTLGIDAEPHDVLPAGVLTTIALPQEIELVARLSATDDKVCWNRLLFCVKEAVYKAWFPLTHQWLDFHDASVSLEPRGTCEAHVLLDGWATGQAHVPTFVGRWHIGENVIITSVTAAM